MNLHLQTNCYYLFKLTRTYYYFTYLYIELILHSLEIKVNNEEDNPEMRHT